MNKFEEGIFQVEEIVNFKVLGQDYVGRDVSVGKDNRREGRVGVVDVGKELGLR